MKQEGCILLTPSKAVVHCDRKGEVATTAWKTEAEWEGPGKAWLLRTSSLQPASSNQIPLSTVPQPPNGLFRVRTYQWVDNTIL